MKNAVKVTYPILSLSVMLSVMLSACSSSDGASPSESFTEGVSGTVDTGNVSEDNSEPVVTGVTGGSPGADIDELDTVTTTGGQTDIVGAARVAIMQGNWETGCLPLGGVFRRETLSVIGDRIQWSFDTFSDEGCVEPVAIGLVTSSSMVQQVVITVPTGDTQETIDGLSAIEVNFHREAATSDGQPLQSSFGVTDFNEGIDYSIVLLQDDSLFFGNVGLAGFEGTSPETRPTSLDFDRPYFRVQ